MVIISHKALLLLTLLFVLATKDSSPVFGLTDNYLTEKSYSLGTAVTLCVKTHEPAVSVSSHYDVKDGNLLLYFSITNDSIKGVHVRLHEKSVTGLVVNEYTDVKLFGKNGEEISSRQNALIQVVFYRGKHPILPSKSTVMIECKLDTASLFYTSNKKLFVKKASFKDVESYKIIYEDSFTKRKQNITAFQSKLFYF